MSQGASTIDEYQLIACVATGNFTQVWEVASQNGSGRFAMKLLLPRAFEEKGQVRVLKHEGRVCKSLDYNRLVTFHDAVFDKKHGYIVMELFRAMNLKSQIGNDLLGLHVRIFKLVESLCLALGYMHDKGWLHCDIKPENILFNKSSELRLIDFSLSARRKKFGGKIKVIQGTRTYIAPETLKRQFPTPQTDMYSLGITLFEILTGSPPFVGSDPKELLSKHLSEVPPPASSFNRNVSSEMDRFIKRLLSKKPKNRYKEMAEVLAIFRGLEVFKEDPEEYAAWTKQKADEKQAESLDEAVRASSRDDVLRAEEEQLDPELARTRAEERRQERLLKEEKKKKRRAKVKKSSPPSSDPAPTPAAPLYPPGVVPGQPVPPAAYPQPYPIAPMPMPVPMPAPMQPNMPYPAPYFQPGFMPQPYPPGMPMQPPPGSYPGQAPPPVAPPPVAPPPVAPPPVAPPPVAPPPVAPQPGAPIPNPAAGVPAVAVPAAPEPNQQPAPPQPKAEPPQTSNPPPPDVVPQRVATPEQNDDDLPLMEELPPIL